MVTILSTSEKVPAKLSVLGLFFVALFVFVSVLPATVQAEEKSAFSPAQKAELEDYLQGFILDNPELLIKSVEKYNERLQAEADLEAQKSVEKHKAFFKTSKEVAVAGNPKGDVTVVEFFDYNCGYCKKALATVLELIKEDKNVRVVLIDYPIFGGSSQIAAKWAVAARMQGKYMPFHTALMENKLPLSETNLENMAKGANLDIDQLKKDIESAAVEKELERNKSIGKDLSITGTPAFIVDSKPFRGYIPYDALEAAIKDARNK